MSRDALSPGEQLAENVWPQLEQLDPHERAACLSVLTGQWCLDCGAVHPGYPCECAVGAE